MNKPPQCPECSVTLARSHRRGVLERYVLALTPAVRPFRCPLCQRRLLRLTHHPSRQAVLLCLLTILFGVLLIQTIWYVGMRAREYPGGGYRPKDIERQIQLERRKTPNDPDR